MSFSNDCKTEVAKINVTDSHLIRAELEALLRLSSELILRNLKFTISFETLNAMVARRYLDFVKKEYNVETTLLTHQIKKLNQGIYYQVLIDSDPSLIISDFNLLGDSINKEEILVGSGTREAFLRAAFLARGSINDPKNGDYHTEIVTSSDSDALFIQKVMNEFALNAKITKRRNDFVVYLKDVSAIGDFLRIIGASHQAFLLDENVIKREYKASLTRQMNAEIANEMKTLSASKKQIEYINTIQFNIKDLSKIDSSVLLVMKVRLDNPEASFKELIDIIDKDYGIKMTKSGLNHKFIKIKEIASKIEEDKLNTQ